MYLSEYMRHVAANYYLVLIQTNLCNGWNRFAHKLERGVTPLPGNISQNDKLSRKKMLATWYDIFFNQAISYVRSMDHIRICSKASSQHIPQTDCHL